MGILRFTWPLAGCARNCTLARLLPVFAFLNVGLAIDTHGNNLEPALPDPIKPNLMMNQQRSLTILKNIIAACGHKIQKFKTVMLYNSFNKQVLPNYCENIWTGKIKAKFNINNTILPKHK